MGKDATWDRYEYAASPTQPAPSLPSPTSPTSAAQTSPSLPAQTLPSLAQQPSMLTLDVFTTYDRSRLAAFGIEEAYHLNRYRLLDSKRADLGGGVIGNAVLYRNRISSQAWSAVYWDWPVQTSKGVAYERVVINHGKEPGLKQPVTIQATEPTEGPTPGTVGQMAIGAPRGQKQDDPKTRDFLVRFSRQVVTATAGAKA
jgi:hypothetical protein